MMQVSARAPEEKLRAFDEVRIIEMVGKTEWPIASMKFPLPWHSDTRNTLILELYNGKGKDLKPVKVAAVRIEFL